MSKSGYKIQKNMWRENVLAHGTFGEILSFLGPQKKYCFANYLSCYVSLKDCYDTGLKLYGVRLLNKCSKICVILNLNSLK